MKHTDKTVNGGCLTEGEWNGGKLEYFHVNDAVLFNIYINNVTAYYFIIQYFKLYSTKNLGDTH